MMRLTRTMTGMTAIVIGAMAAMSTVRAAPPTVVPSPGYDARLQESRQAVIAPRRETMPAPAHSRHRRRSHHSHW